MENNIKFIRIIKTYTPFAESSYGKYNMYNNDKEIYNTYVHRFKKFGYDTVYFYIQNRVTSVEEKVAEFRSSAFDFVVGDSVELYEGKIYEVEKVVRSVYGYITYYLSAEYQECLDYERLFEEAKTELDAQINELEHLYTNDNVEVVPVQKGTWFEKLKNKLR